MTAGIPIPAAIYLRLTEGGAPEAQQRADCVLAIEQKGWRMAGEFVDRESFTGKPGDDYQRFLATLRSGRIKRVVAYSSERMFRNADAMIQMFRQARAVDVDFYFCKDRLTTEGTHGAMLVHAAHIVADIQRCWLSERTANAMRRRKQQGLSVGRPPMQRDLIKGAIASLLNDGMPQAAVARHLDINVTLVHNVARSLRRQVEV